jgi:hypothetical protein
MLDKYKQSEVDEQVKAFEFYLSEERIRQWMLDMSKQMPEVEPLIAINGSCVCSRGNISAICGEAKSKKNIPNVGSCSLGNGSACATYRQLQVCR